METVNAIGSLDGRYARLTEELADIFSEAGLIRHRVYVEIQWLKFILFDLKLSNVSTDPGTLDSILQQFGPADVLRIKTIEETTNHDVKAVEYFIKENWMHWGCPASGSGSISRALQKISTTQPMR